jgi:multiple sugar transport system substrate-binding protein
VTAGGYEALTQKVLLSIAGGTVPDVVVTGYTDQRTMVESGHAVVLDELMNADPKFNKANQFPAALELGKANGKQYLLPLGTSTPVMMINQDLFQSVGLDPQKALATWEDVRQASLKLKAAGKQGVLWGWSITGNWIFQAMLEHSGGRMVNEAGTQVAFNSEAGLKVLTYLSDLAKDGLMPVTDQTLATFIAGNLGMLVDSSFQRVNTPKQTKFKVGFAGLATPDGKLPSVPAGGNGLMIFSKDKAKRQAAWEFVRYISGEEGGRIVADNSGYTPANRAVISELKAKNAADPAYTLILNQVERIVPWHSWPGKNSNKISKTLRDMQEAALLGKKSPKQALDEAAAEINALLK